MRGVRKGPKGIVNLEETSLPGPRPLECPHGETLAPARRSLPSRVGVGGRGREDGAARTGAGAGSQWREHPLRALPHSPTPGGSRVCTREERGDSGEGRERAGLGGRRVDLALVTRSRNRFCLFSPWLRSAPGSPDHRPQGWGGRHGRGDWKGGTETGRRPRGEEGGAGAGPPHPHAQPPAQVRSGRGPVAPAAPAAGVGLTTATRGPIPGAGLSRSCPWWEVSVSAPPPPRLRPPARCNEKRRSRCIPAAPGPPPPPAPPPGRAPRAPAPDAGPAAAAATLTRSRLAAGSLRRAASSPRRRRAPPPPRPAPGPLPPPLRAAASFSSGRRVCASEAEARTRSPEPRPPRAPALPAPPLGVPRRPQAAPPTAPPWPRSAAAPGRRGQGERAGDAERAPVRPPPPGRPARSFGPRITVTPPGALAAGTADLESQPGNFRRPRPVRVNCAASSSAVNKPFKISGVCKLKEIKGTREASSPVRTCSSACSGGLTILQLASPWKPSPPLFYFLLGRGLASGSRLQTSCPSPVWRVAHCQLEDDRVSLWLLKIKSLLSSLILKNIFPLLTLIDMLRSPCPNLFLPNRNPTEPPPSCPFTQLWEPRSGFQRFPGERGTEQCSEGPPLAQTPTPAGGGLSGTLPLCSFSVRRTTDRGPGKSRPLGRRHRMPPGSSLRVTLSPP